MPGRGELTPAIEAEMKLFLRREVTREELRLYPYLLYVMVNDRRIDPNRMNEIERGILSLLREAGHIDGGAGGLAMTRQFFLWANGIVFQAYAAYDNFVEEEPRIGDGSADAALFISEEAFRAGFSAGSSGGQQVDDAWSAFEPSERAKELS